MQIYKKKNVFIVFAWYIVFHIIHEIHCQFGDFYCLTLFLQEIGIEDKQEANFTNGSNQYCLINISS